MLVPAQARAELAPALVSDQAREAVDRALVRGWVQRLVHQRLAQVLVA